MAGDFNLLRCFYLRTQTSTVTQMKWTEESWGEDDRRQTRNLWWSSGGSGQRRHSEWTAVIEDLSADHFWTSLFRYQQHRGGHEDLPQEDHGSITATSQGFTNKFFKNCLPVLFFFSSVSELHVIKITDFCHTYKWENSHKWWPAKYFFALLFVSNFSCRKSEKLRFIWCPENV